MKPINTFCEKNSELIIAKDYAYSYYWTLNSQVLLYVITDTKNVKALGHDIIIIMKYSSSWSKHYAYWFSEFQIVRKKYLKHTYVDYAYLALHKTMLMVMITQKQNVRHSWK
jgi:hypothetical protein